MRCIKCGYISFDFNQVCPKCNRGLYDEQRRLNLPSFRPDPPMLLGRLLGESYDADIDIRPDQSAVMEEAGQDIDMGIEDSFSGLAEGKPSFEDEEELDLISLEPDEHEHPASLQEAESEDKELVLDLEDISLEESKKSVSARRQKEEESTDLLIEDDDLFLEESSADSSQNVSASEIDFEHGGKEIIQDVKEEEEISFSLEDLSFEDLEIEDAGPPGLGDNLPDKATEPEDVPVADFNLFKDNGTMDAFYLDSNAEGLTKEIDMKKFRKDGGKEDDRPE